MSDEFTVVIYGIKYPISMSRRVTFDVGGTKYTTLVSTLLKLPESRFGLMFKNRQNLEKFQKGEEIFVDRNGDTFKYVLEYLRDGDVFVLPEGDEKTTILKQLRLEAKYFLLDGLMAVVEEKLQTLTQDGWKVDDIVTKDDLAQSYDLEHLTAEDYLQKGSTIIGSIVRFQSHGKTAVRFKYSSVKDDDHHDSRMLFVDLKPKRA